MNQLLQGDVGSGKTVIAALAMKSIIHANAQAAMMAPTSILAEQHFKRKLQLVNPIKSFPNMAKPTCVKNNCIMFNDVPL